MINVELWSLSKKIRTSKQWQLIREAVRREFAFEAIFGNAATEITNFLSVFNIQLLPTIAIVVQADTDGLVCMNNDVVKMRQNEIYARTISMLEQDIEGIITVVGQENIFAITAGERDVAILLPVNLRESPDSIKAIANRYARHIKAHLSKNLAYTISLGIGQGYEIKNIRQSYMEACAALKYKFYQGNGTIIHYSEVSWGDRESQKIFIEYETKLLGYIRKGEWLSVTNVIADMLDKIARSRRVHPDVLKVRVLELLTVVSRGVMELGGNPDTLLDIKVRSGDEITRVTTSIEMKAWLTGIISEMCSLLVEKQHIAIIRAVNNAKQFIAENYHLDISLDDIAKREYLSLSYFSRAFAELVGMNFTDYLKNLRIKRAQALLLSTDKSIAEIAAKVGYQDPNYFSRVFKLVTGKSPLQYRQGTNPSMHGGKKLRTEL